MWTNSLGDRLDKTAVIHCVGDPTAEASMDIKEAPASEEPVKQEMKSE